MSEQANQIKKFGIISVILICGLWLGSVVFLDLVFEGAEIRGQFGDSFGAVNSLFSGLAFVAIVVTILMQREELSMQREELRLQRDELTLTRKELARTASAQEFAGKLQAEQLRIAIMPIFQFQSICISQRPYLFITNGSENVAFDVDIWLFFRMGNEELAKTDFINKELIDKYKKVKGIDELTDEGEWSLSDRGIYASLPAGYRVTIPIITDPDFVVFDVFLQYRDSLGNNYGQVIRFSQNVLNYDKTPFSIVEFSPSTLSVQDRVDLTSSKVELLNQESESSPSFVRETIKIHKSAIPHAYMKGVTVYGVEDKWEAHQL